MFCPNCGNAVQNDNAFCGECGAAVAQESTAVPLEYRKSRKKIWIAVLLGLVLVVGVIWYVTLPGASSPEEAIIQYAEAVVLGDLEAMDKYSYENKKLRFGDEWEEYCERYKEDNIIEVSCEILEVRSRSAFDMESDKIRLITSDYTEFTTEDLEETAWVIFEVTIVEEYVQTGEWVTKTSKNGWIAAKLDGRWYYLYDRGY